jgi:DNA repair proteins
MNQKPPKWQHPGGKLRELGAETLTDAELLSILIAPGITGKPAEEIAAEILQKFGGFKGMANVAVKRICHHNCFAILSPPIYMHFEGFTPWMVWPWFGVVRGLWL